VGGRSLRAGGLNEVEASKCRRVKWWEELGRSPARFSRTNYGAAQRMEHDSDAIAFGLELFLTLSHVPQVSAEHEQTLQLRKRRLCDIQELCVLARVRSLRALSDVCQDRNGRPSQLR
jgi:hypothetical protein